MDQSSADIRSHLENRKLLNEIVHESNRQCTNLGNGDGSKFPQRIGQPDCQYFLRTGDCKYGTACKYHHPLDRGGSLQKEIQGEKACAYYTRTGACKFGSDCKFHHPQPGVASPMKSLPSSAMHVFRPHPASDYARYNGTVPVWYMASPYFPASYMPMFPPPAWIPGNKGPMRHMRRMDEAEKSRREPSHGVLTGTVHSTDDESEESSTPRQAEILPEREGEPECRYYLRTGGCKFGSMCKFHHPKDRAGTPRTSHLNAIGFPLRPGQAECSFYLRHGVCKYGRACKFHHPEIAPAAYD